MEAKCGHQRADILHITLHILTDQRLLIMNGVKVSVAVSNQIFGADKQSAIKTVAFASATESLTYTRLLYR